MSKQALPIGEPRMMGRGKKVYTVKNNSIEVDLKYDILKSIGYGAYGFVCAAKDTSNGTPCAIKKIPKVFEDLIDGKRILREIKLLPYLQHENIMGIIDIMRPSGDVSTFRDLYIVCELMETDLHQVIRSKQRLTDEHFQYFIFQVLRALKFMHSAGVIHRDLKPGNLLVNGNCDVKVCDFGLARGGVSALRAEGMELTDYVVTRWYRPPELLLMCYYSGGVDIWSAGCILAELVNGRALFPGRDYINQLALITDVLGLPEKRDLSFVKSAEAASYIRNLPSKKPKGVSNVVSRATRQCLSLLEQMLIFTPTKRISAGRALRHPYLAGLYDPEDDIEFEPRTALQVDWGFDNHDVKEPELRRLFWDEICKYHP